MYPPQSFFFFFFFPLLQTSVHSRTWSHSQVKWCKTHCEETRHIWRLFFIMFPTIVLLMFTMAANSQQVSEWCSITRVYHVHVSNGRCCKSTTTMWNQLHQYSTGTEWIVITENNCSVHALIFVSMFHQHMGFSDQCLEQNTKFNDSLLISELLQKCSKFFIFKCQVRKSFWSECNFNSAKCSLSFFLLNLETWNLHTYVIVGKDAVKTW